MKNEGFDGFLWILTGLGGFDLCWVLKGSKVLFPGGKFRKVPHDFLCVLLRPKRYSDQYRSKKNMKNEGFDGFLWILVGSICVGFWRVRKFYFRGEILEDSTQFSLCFAKAQKILRPIQEQKKYEKWRFRWVSMGFDGSWWVRFVLGFEGFESSISRGKILEDSTQFSLCFAKAQKILRPIQEQKKIWKMKVSMGFDGFWRVLVGSICVGFWRVRKFYFRGEILEDSTQFSLCFAKAQKILRPIQEQKKIWKMKIFVFECKQHSFLQCSKRHHARFYSAGLPPTPTLKLIYFKRRLLIWD